MDLNVPKSFFDYEYNRLMNINDYNGFDEHVIDVVKALKSTPFIHKICPRWSCQGHDNISRNSDYEFIFVTQDDGYEILYEMFMYMNIKLINSGFGCATAHYSVVNLINDKISEIDAVPHVIIQMTSYGAIRRINKFKNLWLETIEEFSKRYPK